MLLFDERPVFGDEYSRNYILLILLDLKEGRIMLLASEGFSRFVRKTPENQDKLIVSMRFIVKASGLYAVEP